MNTPGDIPDAEVAPKKRWRIPWIWIVPAIAVAVGAPVSTGLMSLDGLFGLKGWQIMYLAEGFPTIVLGILTFFVMINRPEQATFLTQPEKDWLIGKIAA